MKPGWKTARLVIPRLCASGRNRCAHSQEERLRPNDRIRELRTSEPATAEGTSVLLAAQVQDCKASLMHQQVELRAHRLKNSHAHGTILRTVEGEQLYIQATEE